MSESPFLNAVSPLSGVVSPFGCKPPKYAIVVPALSLWRAATPPWNGTFNCTTPNRTTLQKAPTPSLLSLMVICHYAIAGFNSEALTFAALHCAITPLTQSDYDQSKVLHEYDFFNHDP